MRPLILLIAATLSGAAKDPAPTKPPFENELLMYTINWPSGLSLGEGRMQSVRTGESWRFELALDASIPGFSVIDSFRSKAGGEFCSEELTKQSTHGKRTANETTTFDPARRTAVRETKSGGKSEFQIAACPRDALTFLYFLRRELAQGRVPSPQTVYFGGAYQVKLDYRGTQSVKANDKSYSADRVTVTFKGPASSTTFEMFFARDAVRTPVIIRVPFLMGTFSMELAP